MNGQQQATSTAAEAVAEARAIRERWIDFTRRVPENVPKRVYALWGEADLAMFHVITELRKLIGDGR